jgi:hypothetical protein
LVHVPRSWFIEAGLIAGCLLPFRYNSNGGVSISFSRVNEISPIKRDSAETFREGN